jgi:uracil-DNA glycosylase family 4
MTRTKPSSCQSCVLYNHGTDFSQPEGQGSLGVMVVAEASGESEAREGLPLRPYAPAGSLFERALRRLTYSREQFVVTNVLRCRPRNNLLDGMTYEAAACSQCRPNLIETVQKHRPRVILTLGNVPLRELTGHAGKARTVSHLRGYAHAPASADLGDTVIFSTYHPSFIRRGAAHLTGVFMRDIQRAVMIAQRRDMAYTLNAFEKYTAGTLDDLHYITHPSYEDARSFALYLRDNPGVPVAYDLETAETLDLDEDAREQFADTEIRTIQFSHTPGTGICFPWTNGYRDIASEILRLPNPKVGHNSWLFDLKVLKAVQEREGRMLVPRDLGHDTLQMFHHWQPDLPAHLQYAASFVQFPFPWKHLSGTNLEFYGIADVDATLRIFNEAQRTMKARGIWDGYVRSVYEVRPVLTRIEDRGLPIDDVERLKLGEEFRKAWEELAQILMTRFPESAKKLDAYKPNKKGELVLPPELRKLPEDEWTKLFREPDKWKCGCDKEHRMEVLACSKCGKSREDGSIKAGKWYRYGIREVPEAALSESGDPITVGVPRWCYIPEFNPNSYMQLIDYMIAKRHPVPKDKKKAEASGNGDTTAKKELVRLASKTGDDFYLKVIECREYGKMRGTYIDGFAPAADQRVHATITFDTATWQFAAKNPNIMNFPKHGRLAKIVRKMVAAPAGHKIVEFDFKAFHVLTTGFFAESAQYMRLARLDMHSFVAGHFAKCWDAEKLFDEPDDELRAKFKWFKSDETRKLVRDKKAKPSILGIGFGLGVNKLYDMNRESFSSLKEAKLVREVIEHLFPEVFKWQQRVKQLAHDQTYLRSPHGGIRWFYDVFQWNSKRREWIGGDQAEQALAFLPANAAFGHIREKLRMLDELGYAEKYGLVNNIHDAVTFIPREEDVNECLYNCYQVLRGPSAVLKHPVLAPDGLYCDVDGSVGSNWAGMVDVGIPKTLEVTA